ncbi:MAG: glycoside hydrolase family 2 protein [Anaerolineales bacterium]|nr:glycoside hydrolase family 2 protein [Anaerolineales bacterium]
MILPTGFKTTSPLFTVDSVPATIASLTNETDIEKFDWWYFTEFEFNQTGKKHILIFDGLATLAEIWLNDEKILTTENMFLQYKVDVTEKLKEKNTLAIRFRSIHQALEVQRKRPKWKTKLVENQNLRWFRTTLLGFIPGWTPPIKPIGIWREVHLESVEIANITDFNLQTLLKNSNGVVKVKANIENLADQPCEILFEINNDKYSLFTGSSQNIQIDKEIILQNIKSWNPHTHGEANLYPCKLILKVANQVTALKEARVGFRQVHLNRENNLFQIQINNKNIFARGAVWTINDIVSLDGNEDELKTALTLARDAGMNMLRIGGTMIYEQDAFYDLCDELGIMIWQDFIFANMDYPVNDESFHQNILDEANYQIKRLSEHASVIFYCGNSEVEQQAAMLGIPNEMWRNDWFANELPALIKTLHEDSLYVPSSPSEGVFPFYTSEGVTHYYGVGAYLRDVNDARRADVKFTSETLGFSNIPEDKIISDIKNNFELWKHGVPHDTGAEWDFEDVREHYMKKLFNVNVTELKNKDLDRYLILGRVTTGEMASQVFSEWRSSYSNCNGGLVWFYKDIVPGAGWGVIDSQNNPKATYYYLKRIFQPVQVTITDEGLQGLHLHIINESPLTFAGTIEFAMIKDGNLPVAKAQKEIKVESNQRVRIIVEEMLGGFYDTSYAYKFGPPKQDVSCATLKGEHGKIVSQQFHFPLTHHLPFVDANVIAELTDNGLSISSDNFLYSVQIQSEGVIPEDNFFHLMPNEKKEIKFKSHNAKPQVEVRALNLKSVIHL